MYHSLSLSDKLALHNLLEKAVKKEPESDPAAVIRVANQVLSDLDVLANIDQLGPLLYSASGHSLPTLRSATFKENLSHLVW